MGVRFQIRMQAVNYTTVGNVEKSFSAHRQLAQQYIKNNWGEHRESNYRHIISRSISEITIKQAV